MNLRNKIVAAAALASTLAPAIWAQSEPPVKLDPVVVTGTKPKIGVKKADFKAYNVEIRNFQDESLGRIIDLGVDLVNGRIVEVLVKSDSSLNVDNKVVALPPLTLVPDGINQVYRIDVSTEVFKSAPAVDLAHWDDFGRSDRVAATYHLFGQDPYFLETGDTASTTASRPKVPLGYVERSIDLLDMDVRNPANVDFGRVWSLTLDIPRGRILNVIVLAPGNFKTKSIIPAMALSFNASRDGLVLDDSKIEYDAEPRLFYTEAAYGQPASSREESYKGPHTTVALEQGTSYRDIDQTVRINREIRAAKINHEHVEVGTQFDRVTLRGWVDSAEDKRRIGAIAIAAARLELVDNQIKVGKPVGRD